MTTEKKRWYAMPVQEVAQHFSTNLETGLDEKEARARLKALGENEIFRIPHRSFGEHLLHLSVNPLAIILILSAAVMAFMGNIAPFAVCLATLVFYYITGAAVYVRSHRVLEIMGKSSLPLATVIRGGKAVTLPQQAVVPGDVIMIRSGQIVPADARLIKDERLVVIETGITDGVGNITKNAERWDARMKEPHECANMVWASTVVLGGRGLAIVTETGRNTHVSRTKKNVSAITYEKLGMFRELSRIAYFVSLGSIALTFVLTLAGLALPTAYTALEILTLVLAVMCALMSEAYTVLGHLTVALGVYGTIDIKKNVNTGTLIRNAEHIDDLADITTLAIPADSICSNKNIKLDRICLFDETVEVTDGEELPEKARQLLIKAVISTGKYTASRLVSKGSKTGEPYTVEEDAIIKCAAEQGVYNVELDSTYPIIGHANKSEAGFETTLIKWYGENRIILRGEVEKVLANCTYYKTGESNNLSRMTPRSRSSIMTMANQMMRQAHRVVAIASGVSKYNTLTRFSELRSGLTFEGIIAFNEPILPGAAYNIAKCREAGINVILFTPDVAEKNIHLARSLGIMKGDRDLEVSYSPDLRLGDEIFRTNLDDCKLYQGFSVSDKRRIIRLLKEKGEKVAYYGRNTSEIILCKEADIGVTDALTISPKLNRSVAELSQESEQEINRVSSVYMAPTGDAMRFSADVIVSPITDDGKGGFNALVNAIGSAKDIYIKMKRIVTYLLSANLARLILLVPTLFVPRLTLLSVPTVMIGGIVFDLMMSIAIAFSAQNSDVLKTKDKRSAFIIDIRELIYSVILALTLAASAIIGGAILLGTCAYSGAQLTCFTFLCTLVSCSVWFIEGRYKTGIFGRPFTIGSTFAFCLLVFTALTALSMAVPFIGNALGIVPITLEGWAALLGIGILALGVCELVKMIFGLIKK